MSDNGNAKNAGENCGKAIDNSEPGWYNPIDFCSMVRALL